MADFQAELVKASPVFGARICDWVRLKEAVTRGAILVRSFSALRSEFAVVVPQKWLRSVALLCPKASEQAEAQMKLIYFTYSFFADCTRPGQSEDDVCVCHGFAA